MDDTHSPDSANSLAGELPLPDSASPNDAFAAPANSGDSATELPPQLSDESPPALADWSPPPPLIKLVGVGGAGVNIVSRISAESLEALSLAVMDCDAQKLGESPVGEKWLLGGAQRRGLSTGGEIDLGRQAAEASRDKLASAGGGADLLFLVAGLGGGTGSAVAPLVAAEATNAGGLVIGFAVLPFSFEGGRRAKQAEAALVALRRACDAVIVLPNDLLLQETSEGASALAAFGQADEWISRAVRSLWRLLCKTGLMNVDFAALQRAFEYRGSKTVFGLGFGGSEHRTGGEGSAAKAVLCTSPAEPLPSENLGDQVLASLRACPLMHAPETARRADRLLVSVSGGPSVLTLGLVNQLVQAVSEQFGRSAELVVGATLDESLGERVELCLIGASDIGGKSVRRSVRAEVSPSENRPPQSGESDLRAESPARASTAEVTDLPLPKAGKSGVRAPKLPRGKLSVVTDHQGEFGFSAETERGYFRDMEATLFEGEDLDPPTYLRKGVKIAVN